MDEDQLLAKASISIAAPLAKVWDGLINPEIIKHYLFGSEVITDWKEGSPIIYRGNYQGKSFEDKGEVVTVDPEKLLVLTHWSPLSGKADIPENYHTVTYELSEENGVTKVTISQNNSSSEEGRKQNEQFWSTALEGLKKILEK